MFSSAVEEGSFEAMAYGALLCWGKGDKRCGGQEEFIKQYLSIY